MVVLATGNCGSGSWILGPGQLKITARAAGIFFRAVEIFVRVAGNFRPGSRKIMVWEAEIFISGSRIIIFV